MVGRWYSNYYAGNPSDVYELTLAQIGQYENAALQRGLAWAK
jgi:hypothetical protein